MLEIDENIRKEHGGQSQRFHENHPLLRNLNFRLQHLYVNLGRVVEIFFRWLHAEVHVLRISGDRLLVLWIRSLFFALVSGFLVCFGVFLTTIATILYLSEYLNYGYVVSFLSMGVFISILGMSIFFYLKKIWRFR